MSTSTVIADAVPPPWADGPYSVKRHGVSITNCDSEPVQTPGCVQGHGALLVLAQSSLTILQASENSDAVLGRAATDLLGRPVAEILGKEGAAHLADFVAREPIHHNPLHVLTLPARADLTQPLDVSVHAVDGVVILEFEATGHGTGEEPDYFSLIKRTIARLQRVATTTELFAIATDEVRELTGIDRAMVYRFHADGHGEVIAESRRADLPSWKGFHYPAEDIPLPAREVFKRTWLRPVPDVSAPLAELVPLARPDTGGPLQMTWCMLRGPSVMYTEYLRNMGVTASLTMAIRRGEELWGLIACHHYAGPKHVPHPVRAACELVAQIVSIELRGTEEREHLAYRLKMEGVHNDLVMQAAQEGGLAAMMDGRPELLDGLHASGAALFHRERWWKSGRTPTDAQLDALANWLATRPEFERLTRPVYVTDSLARDYPPGAEFAEIASGLLAFSLSISRRSLLLWFRPETIQTVHWGGNPHDMPTVMGPHGPRLTPRTSFELFKESVRQRSLPWLPVEVDAAVRLRMLVLELVVGRAERLAELNADLARSNDELDAFAYVVSHDLKEPLRGIYKYAHQMIEELPALQDEQRRKLDRLVRLSVRMDGLLDSLLHYSRVGRTTLALEEVDLNEIVREAMEMVDSRVTDQRTLVVPRRLPAILCDRARCREIFTNLFSNALKYNESVNKTIEVGALVPGHPARPVGAPAEASGETIYYVRDNGIGIDPSHFEQVFKMFKRLHGRDEYGGGTGAGLPIVKRLVERHGGQIWPDSALGAGTTMYFTLSAREVGP